MTYTLRPGARERECIPLRATADADVRTLFWFVDDRYVGRSKPGTPLFWKPRPGRYRVRVVDDLGRADSAALRATLLPQRP